jgi:SPP1 gp7 family putative phage head morphogenesis protein
MDISTRLWRQDFDTGMTIRQTLNNMFVTGRPPQDFAEQLQKQIGAVRVDANGNVTGTGKKYEAYRLLYNESAHAVNQAQIQSYRDNGINEYEIVAALDKTTCDICASFDGKHFPVSKAVEGVNHPSFHVNCRCTTAPYIPEAAGITRTRASRDPATGKTVPTTAQTYGEWKAEQDKKYGAGTVDRERKKAQNEASDFKQYQGMKSVLKENSPKSFAEFQNLKYNKSDGWEHMKQSYTETNRFNSLTQKAADLNIKGAPVKNFEKLDISGYQFATQHINADRQHLVSKQEAQSFIDNAVFAIDRWNGEVRIFISESGASVVNLKDKIVSTSYKSSEYDDKFKELMEGVKK